MTPFSLDLLVGTLWQPNKDKLELLQANSTYSNLQLHNLKQPQLNTNTTVPNCTVNPDQKNQVQPPPVVQLAPMPKVNSQPKHDIPIVTASAPITPQLNEDKVITPVKHNVGDWISLVNSVQSCENCKLSSGRTHVVIERGSRTAQWMFIGEGPGENEDLQGKPFVGASGQLLDKMIAAMNLNIETDVYIANVIKCRPPRNRNPEAEEIAACNHFLQKQIEFVKPQIIITLGRFAAQTLLNTELAVGKLRGKVNYYTDIPLIVTYHPSYLLRTPDAKKEAWEDLQLAMKTFATKE